MILTVGHTSTLLVTRHSTCAASRLTDPRLAQVFDVEDSGGQAYIVLEWVSGDSLTDLLDAGPLDPALACSLVCDAARAIAGAHVISPSARSVSDCAGS